MKRRDDVYRSVVAEIERQGGKIDSERKANGSHVIIYWSVGDKRFQSVVARAAGNWRSIANAVAGIRAKVRQEHAR